MARRIQANKIMNELGEFDTWKTTSVTLLALNWTFFIVLKSGIFTRFTGIQALQPILGISTYFYVSLSPLIALASFLMIFKWVVDEARRHKLSAVQITYLTGNFVANALYVYLVFYAHNLTK